MTTEESYAPPSPQPTRDHAQVDTGVLESPNCVGCFPLPVSTSPTTKVVSPEHVERMASPYRRLLAMGVTNVAVMNRMRHDGVGENEDVRRAVFGKSIIDCFHDQEEACREDEQAPSTSHMLLLPKATSVPRHSAQAQELIDYWKAHKDDNKRKGKLELIDNHRAKEIVLALRAFSDKTFNDLAEAIDCLEPMDRDLVFFLGKLVPTDKERNILLAFRGSDEDLAPSSLWLRRSLTVPELEAKVKVMQIMATFNDRVDSLSKQFTLVERASDQALGSPKLKHLLHFVLRIGRTLKKDASGLKSCELPSLNPTEEPVDLEHESRMTVLDFVVRCVGSRERRSLSLMSELPECEEASRIDVAELLQDMSELSHALETCKSQLKDMKRDEIATAHWFETGVSLHDGVTRLEHFVADSCVRISRLEFDRDMALASCRNLAEFCNVKDPEKSTACLALLTKFARDLDRASRHYFEREYDASMVCDGEDSTIDARHLRHVKSMVEMYDKMLSHKNVDPEAHNARQLTALVIAVGPTIEEKANLIDETPLHRVKSVIRLYNTLLAEKEVAGPKNKFIQGAQNTQATQHAVPTPTLQNGTPVSSTQVTGPKKEPLIDCRSLRHIKSVVGTEGELLISPRIEAFTE